MGHRDPKFFNLRDTLFALIIIGFLIFTYIKPDNSDQPGATIPAPETKEPVATEELSDLELLEQPIPAE